MTKLDRQKAHEQLEKALNGAPNFGEVVLQVQVHAGKVKMLKVGLNYSMLAQDLCVSPTSGSME